MSSFPGDTAAPRRDIRNTALALPGLGLAKGTSGNVSERVKSVFLVTCSSAQDDAHTVRTIMTMDFNGCDRGDTLPSSDWRRIWWNNICPCAPWVNQSLSMTRKRPKF